LELLLRFLEVFANDHSLARSQSVGLEYIGWAKSLEVIDSFIIGLTAKRLISSGGDPIALHEGFTEVLAPLKLCSSSIWADDQEIL